MILAPGWYTAAQVARLLNYGESKVRMLLITGRLRSIKDGRSRRILPEWRINSTSPYTVIVGRGVSGGM